MHRDGHLVRVLDMDLESGGAFTYDLLTGETTPMTPPPTYFMNVTEAAGYLYAMGDIEGSENGVVQKYVYETDEWVRITPMQPIIVERTVSLRGYLHVIGYRQGNLAMQVYDDLADRWNDRMPPRVRRGHMAAVEHLEKLFLIGGMYNEGWGCSRDVEVYDPVRDEWEFYPELTVEYYGVWAQVVKGRLFVYSNCLAGPRLITTLDESSRQWIVIEDSSPLHHINDYCFCPIEEDDLVVELWAENKACDKSDWLLTGFENETFLKSSN